MLIEYFSKKIFGFGWHYMILENDFSYILERSSFAIMYIYVLFVLLFNFLTLRGYTIEKLTLTNMYNK